MILDLYTEFVESVMAIPLYTGEKTAHERFAGADKTYTIEAMMPDFMEIFAGS